MPTIWTGGCCWCGQYLWWLVHVVATQRASRCNITVCCRLQIALPLIEQQISAPIADSIVVKSRFYDNVINNPHTLHYFLLTDKRTTKTLIFKRLWRHIKWFNSDVIEFEPLTKCRIVMDRATVVTDKWIVMTSLGLSTMYEDTNQNIKVIIT